MATAGIKPTTFECQSNALPTELLVRSVGEYNISELSLIAFLLLAFNISVTVSLLSTRGKVKKYAILSSFLDPHSSKIHD